MASDSKSLDGAPLILPSWSNDYPGEWSWYRLDAICSAIVDCPHSTPEIVDDGPYFMARTTDILDGVLRTEITRRVSESTYLERTRRMEPRYGDLLYSREGTYFGISAEVPRGIKVCLGQRMVLLRPDSRTTNSTFLRYWLNSSQVQTYIQGYRDGSVAERLNLPTIRQIPVCLPELPEQRAISHILAILDERIDLNRKMNATLEAIGQALFRSWFVDFDPVRAKAEGHSTGLPDHIAALFPDSFEEDEIGEHPRGWKSAKLGDILSVDKGVSYKGEHLGSGVPMINLGCFLGKGRFNASAIKRYSGDYKPRHTVPVGGLVVANTDITQRREVIGSPAIVPPIPGTNAALFTHHVFALRLDSSAPHFKLFVYFLLLNDEFRDRAMGFATGTTVLALPKDAILDLKYPSPPNELVTTFNRIAGPLKEMQWRNAEVSQSLTSLRDTLLPKLISGQIRVGEIGEAE